MYNKVRLSAVALVILTFFSLAGSIAKAEEGCQGLGQYIWTFQPDIAGASNDPSWNGVSQMNAKLHHGAHHLAAPGSIDKDTPYPFPGIPSVVSTSLDKDTYGRVKSLYDRYVVLDRSIEDMWQDKYANDTSATSMQKFASERDATVDEMNRIAKAAKEELVRYTFKQKNCFDQYEAYVSRQTKQLQQQLDNAVATLRTNEEIWAHAEQNQSEAIANAVAPLPTAPRLAETAPTQAAPAATAGNPGVQIETLGGSRAPASIPAITPDH
jgi:hypothetical protein